jgi:hypothetical protein
MREDTSTHCLKILGSTPSALQSIALLDRKRYTIKSNLSHYDLGLEHWSQSILPRSRSVIQQSRCKER